MYIYIYLYVYTYVKESVLDIGSEHFLHVLCQPHVLPVFCQQTHCSIYIKTDHSVKKHVFQHVFATVEFWASDVAFWVWKCRTT